MKIFDLLQRRALVSRVAAQRAVASLKEEVAGSPPRLEVDFSGVEAATPSFIDELIGGLGAAEFAGYQEIRFVRPPSRLSEKFRAIGRGREISMEENEAGEWLLSLPLASPVSPVEE